MKNITVSLPETVARWVRTYAARNNTSVSRLVGEMLRQRMGEESGYRRAMKSFLSRKPKRLKKGGGYPTRGEIHERGVLR